MDGIEKIEAVIHVVERTARERSENLGPQWWSPSG